jgi:proline iminopeptidase
MPGILIHGRFDVGAPLASTWELRRVWPSADLVIVPDAGHVTSHPALTAELVRATDRFAGLEE